MVCTQLNREDMHACVWMGTDTTTLRLITAGHDPDEQRGGGAQGDQPQSRI